MTRYFKTDDHLRNFLAKILRENARILDQAKLLNVEAYCHALRVLNIADDFGRVVGSAPKLLHEDEFWNWVRSYTPKSSGVESEIEHVLTKEFLDLTDVLRRVTGVYSFWNADEVPIYVGMSTDLGYRLIQSFESKFGAYGSQVFVRATATNTGSDAALLEVFMIAHWKPALNQQSKFSDELTIAVDVDVDALLTEPIQCNVT